MKKIILLAATAFMITAGVNAQEINFGAKAGANFASLSGDLGDDIDGRTSFNVGVVANIGISEKFAVQPEIVYSSQGGSSEIQGEDFTVKFDYINVPILADFKVGEGFSLQAGPQVGFNITSEVDADGGSADIEDVETVDLSLAFGAQYKLDQGIFFQARYGLGLSDIISDVDGKNNVISLSIGYFFN